MITTNTNIREMPTGLTTLPTIEFIDVTRSADARTWSGGDNRPFIETCLLKWKWLRVLLCVDDEWLEDVKLEASVRDKIRDELKLQQVGYSIDSVRMVTRAIYDTTKYDMSNYKMQEDAEALAMKEEEELRLSREKEARDTEVRAWTHFARAWSEVFGYQPEWPQSPQGDRVPRGDPLLTNGGVATVNINTVVSHVPVVVNPRVQVVPRFAAALTLALRAKFGRMAYHEANRLLIEREYLKVCRDANVRHCDIEYHRQFVINAYFNEGVTDELSTVRTRLPRWLRVAFGSVPNAAPTVC
jgi:hypothetical protein